MGRNKWTPIGAGFILKPEYAPEGIVVTIYETDQRTRRGASKYRVTMRNTQTDQRISSSRAWTLASAKRHGWMVVVSDLWLGRVGFVAGDTPPPQEGL